MNGASIILWGLITLSGLSSITLLMGKGAAGFIRNRFFNEKKLYRVVGGGLSIVTVVLIISAWFDFELPVVIEWLIPWGILVPVAIIIILAFTICRADCSSNANEGIRKIPNRLRIMPHIILAITLVVVSLMFYFGEQEPRVSINEDSIRIHGSFGVSIDVSEITSVTLIEKSMEGIGIPVRKNGYCVTGMSLKGKFQSERLGRVLLFVKAKSSPTILITSENLRDVYLSLDSSGDTRRLYDEILATLR